MGRDAALRQAAGYLTRTVPRLARQNDAPDDLLVVRTLSDSIPAGRRDVRVECAEQRHQRALTEFSRRHCRRRALTRPASHGGGAESLLGFVGDELVAQLFWVDHRGARAHSDVVRLGLSLDEDEVYAFDLFVAPDHRGDGTAAAFVGGSCEVLARLGYRQMWGVADGWNLPAKWLYLTTGWRTVRRVPSGGAVPRTKPRVTSPGG
jgi:GNAT superfamily N-acetyltransferase